MSNVHKEIQPVIRDMIPLKKRLPIQQIQEAIIMRLLMPREYEHKERDYHEPIETRRLHSLSTPARVVSESPIQSLIELLCLIFQGNGMLMVGVFGPKHPCEEVFIKHVGNNQYNVQYV